MKFSFYRGAQLRQLIIVIGFSVVFVAVYLLMRGCAPEREGGAAFHVDSARVKEFLAHLDTIEYKWGGSYLRESEKLPPRSVFEFDPNTIDSIGLLRLGFRPFMAHNLLAFRRAGGVIYDEQRFKQIYGIDSVLIDSLSGYVHYPKRERFARDTVVQYKRKEYFVFDLNCADTALLAQLPGIGVGRARQIVSYRNNLGGYYSVEQLREIENMPDSVVDHLVPYAAACLDSIRKVRVNYSSIRTLRRHPYINYYQAKAIYNLRWDAQHEGVLCFDDLRTVKELSEADLDRLKPYLDFSDYSQK